MISRTRVQRTRAPLHAATHRLRDAMLTRGELEMAHAHLLGVNVLDYRATGVLLGQGPITPGELADELGLSRSAASNVIDRLEAAGNLTRERDTSDGRRVILRITDSAAGTMMGNFAPLLQSVEAAVRSMTPAQQEAVTTYLGTVVNAMEELVADLRARAAGTDQEGSADA